MSNAASVAGPLVAGVIIAQANIGWAYGVDALTFTLAMWAALRLPALPPVLTDKSASRGGWLADRTPGTAEGLRLMDATPVGCGQSKTTAWRSNLFGWAGYGYESAHTPLVLGRQAVAADHPDGTVTGFGLANPKPFGERGETREILTAQPANHPRPGSTVVTDKGLSGADNEQLFTDCDLVLVRPARRDETTPRPFPNWLRQRVEAIIWTLKSQLRLEQHRARVPAGLWARILQRLLALNTAIWHNWTIGAPVKRSLIAYDH